MNLNATSSEDSNQEAADQVRQLNRSNEAGSWVNYGGGEDPGSNNVDTPSDGHRLKYDEGTVRSTIEDEQKHGARTLIVPDRDMDPQLPVRRTVLLLSMSIAGMFASKEANLEGIGPLGSIIAGAATSFLLGSHAGSVGSEAVEENVSWVWNFLQPLLFGLIGASVDLGELDPRYAGLGMVVLLIALVARSAATFVSVWTGEFDYSEMLFIVVAWVPKATVQAAFAGVALKEVSARMYEDPEE